MVMANLTWRFRGSRSKDAIQPLSVLVAFISGLMAHSGYHSS
jgi:hypothetical protein